MKYYIIAGEASGDLHASNLVKALKKKDPNAEIWGWGGDLMAAAGVTLRKHYRDLAFMGFIEVVKNLGTILKNMAFCKQDILDFKPDALIFVDYPGFNLRIAKWAKAEGFKTFYYISPQIWAWHSSRVHSIKTIIDKMYCILPFETDFYAKYGYEATFVGHPLLDVVAQRQAQPSLKAVATDKPIIALLPGSRKQEIERVLPQMLAVVRHFPDYQFVVAGAPAQTADFYAPFLASTEGVVLVQGQTYDLLQQAAAALVTSGTATLETALFDVPQVVCYKGSSVSFAIAKRVIKVKYISLVNLIADKEIVTELIQDDLNETALTAALGACLTHSARIRADYAALRTMLGDVGASDRTAAAVWHDVQIG